MLSDNKYGEKLKKINFSKSVKKSMWPYFILGDFFFHFEGNSMLQLFLLVASCTSGE